MSTTESKVSTDPYGEEIWLGGSNCGTITLDSGVPGQSWYTGGCMTDNPRDWDALIAEAHLFAAAPAMREALRDTLAAYIAAMANEYDYPGSDWLDREGNADPVVVAARAALAAAEGTA